VKTTIEKKSEKNIIFQKIMLDPGMFADVYHKLVLILNRYYLHKYTFQVDSSEEDAYLNAFNMLIVLTEKRDAMMFIAVGDPRNLEPNECTQVQERLILLKDELDQFIRVIRMYCQLDQFHFLVQDHCFYLYHDKLAKEVKEKSDTPFINDILGYLSDFEPENFVYWVQFKLNNISFLNFGCIDVTLENITELRQRLANYQSVANELPGWMFDRKYATSEQNATVTMNLKFH
jgi:hypothetical protein